MGTSQIIDAYAEEAGLLPTHEQRDFDRDVPLSVALERSRALMAPMAGVSDAAYRLMARAGGARLAYTEMVSVAGLHYSSDKTWELVLPDPAEKSIAVQLFGSKPEQFAEAARAVTDRVGDRLALIDINMACPVPKVVRKGEGSALLDEPELAASIVDSCVSNTNVPVTVKIRAGRVPERICAPEFARSMAQAGASAVAVHGRTASALYRGTATWEWVADVVSEACVPVIGSGDVMDASCVVRMIEQTGAAAAFVARGSYGNPWIFGDARDTTSGGALPVRDARLRLAAFCLHVRLLEATGAHMARARSLAGWYLKGLPHASAWRNDAMTCVSADDFLRLADAARARLDGHE